MTNGHRVALSLLGSALALTGLTACGSDGDDASAPAATVTVTETPSASPTGSASPSQTPTPSETASDTPSDTPSASPPESATATPTDEPTPEPTVGSGVGIPRTYDDARAHFDATGQEPASYKKFQTPSGNIFCVIRDPAIPPGCEISQGAMKDPDTCAGTPTDRVGRVEFHDGRATPVCNTDTIRTPGARTLGYGEVSGIGNILCLSEKIGVTCINTTQPEGFFLHQGEYVIFNAG